MSQDDNAERIAKLENRVSTLSERVVELEKAIDDFRGEPADADTTTEDTFDDPTTGDWYRKSGIVADRTNRVIDGLIEWAEKDDIQRISRKNIEEGITAWTRVDSDDTVEQYVERIVDHGPFHNADPGVWEIDWEKVH